MPVKYRIDYRNYLDKPCRVDISNENYFGEPIILRTAEGSACTIDYNCENENAPIINSNATTVIIAEDIEQVDIFELQTALDRDFKYAQYEDGFLKWSGFVIPDGIQRMLKSAPFDLTITATDGLKLLDTIDYVYFSELEGGNCILNHYRWILFWTGHLNLPLPIRWVNTLINDAFPEEEDVFTGSVRWNIEKVNTSSTSNFAEVPKTAMYVLSGLLKSMRCRLFQANGKWNIERVNDIVSGVYTYREIPATLEGFPTPTVVEDYSALRYISSVSFTSDYSFVEDDAVIAVITVKPGLKSFITIYEQEERENILPNGSMDYLNLLSTQPIYWELIGDTSGSSFFTIPSLYNSTGYAVQINSGNNSGKYFQLIDELPIDCETLYTTINVGFKFCPISGFPLNGDGTVNWDSPSFLFFVKFTQNNGDEYYLNEFGFFQEDFVLIKTAIEGIKEGEIGQIDFNKFQNVPLPNSANPITNENPPSLKVGFYIPDVCAVAFDDVYINVQTNSDRYEAILTGSNSTAKDEDTLQISTSHNGFYISSFMTNYANSGEEMYFSDALYTGVLTSMFAHSVMRSRYLPRNEFNGSIYGNSWSYGECYEIVTFDDKKFIPLNASYNTETCTATIQALEMTNDAIEVQMKHYGTNDKPTLSN